MGKLGVLGLPHLVPSLSACLSVHQHLSSRRHKDRLAGKPPKPSSQHSKLQKHAALAVSILKVSVSRPRAGTLGKGRRGVGASWGAEAGVKPPLSEAAWGWVLALLGCAQRNVREVGLGRDLSGKSEGWACHLLETISTSAQHSLLPWPVPILVLGGRKTGGGESPLE